MSTDQLNWQKDNFENIETAWEGDLWDRRRLGEQLTNYVDRLQCGAVLALDARWGEGKTWFVRNWKRHLETTEIPHNVIYLDAFANDYLDDPFLTIAAEISQVFKDSDEIEESAVNDFNSTTASVLISLAAVIPIIAAKAGMHWIGLGGAGEALQEVYKQGQDVFDTASDEIASKIKEQIEKKIENHHIEKQTIQDFKKELAELAAQLDRSLVFIIDELDRCRPDFAIRLIERIKHFFDIPKIVFVLVMNKSQLLQSIKSYYGYDSELNGDYLEKFVDFSVKLPEIAHQFEYENFIKSQLYTLGELGDRNDFNELYFVCLALQLEFKFNSRELTKKLNQYALLRREEIDKNLIIMMLLVLKKGEMIDYFKSIEQVIRNFNHKLYPNIYAFISKYPSDLNQNIDAKKVNPEEWFMQILKLDYQIDNSRLSKFMQGYRRTIEASKNEFYESSALRFLNKYSFYDLENSQQFFQVWVRYIQSSI